MGMRASDASFLRREVLPILRQVAQISPEAADAVDSLEERLAQPVDRPDTPLPTTIHRTTYGEGYTSFVLNIDGHPVPYIRGCVYPEDSGHAMGERVGNMVLDDRFSLDAPLEEIERWGWFLANAMAVAAGRTSHGENSFIRNPHGRSGGGDPPVIHGTPVDSDERYLSASSLEEVTQREYLLTSATSGCVKPGVCEHCDPWCEYDHPHSGGCMKLIQRPTIGHVRKRSDQSIPNREDVSGSDRVFGKGLKGRKIGYLSFEGVVEFVTLSENIFEIPRCSEEIAFARGMGSTIEDLATNLAYAYSMDIFKVATWRPCEMDPASVGIILVEPLLK